MKNTTLMFFLLAWAGAAAQSPSASPYFEGEIQYQVSVKSRNPNLSDADAARLLGQGTTLTVAFKNGNYRRSSPIQEEYFIGKAQKAYVKFRKLDTLYYVDYSSDTTAVTGVIKSDSIFQIDHYSCKGITINFHGASSRFCYSPDLRCNPVYDSTNTIGHYNAYSRETGGAIYLWNRAEYPVAVITDSCVRVEPKKIDDHVFDLPALPVKKLVIATLLFPAHFPGKQNGWLTYLQSNLNTKLALKYVKLPKGQQEASETVRMEFVVAEDGTISNIHVLNPDEVHRQLAEEAVRVIRESPRWTPGIFYGEKVSTTIKQPVVFMVTR